MRSWAPWVWGPGGPNSRRPKVSACRENTATSFPLTHRLRNLDEVACTGTTRSLMTGTGRFPSAWSFRGSQQDFSSHVPVPAVTDSRAPVQLRIYEPVDALTAVSLLPTSSVLFWSSTIATKFRPINVFSTLTVSQPILKSQHLRRPQSTPPAGKISLEKHNWWQRRGPSIALSD